MDKKRFEEILWEFENDRAKFNLHAGEYFEEVLPTLKEFFLSNEPKADKEAKPTPHKKHK